MKEGLHFNSWPISTALLPRFTHTIFLLSYLYQDKLTENKEILISNMFVLFNRDRKSIFLFFKRILLSVKIMDNPSRSPCIFIEHHFEFLEC